MYICHDEATLQSFAMCYVHCVVCGFIKLYKHDFEVMKYICYVMPTAISGL